MTEATIEQKLTGRTVFLSIHPEHAEAILDGRKLYEYRRAPPGTTPPYAMLLYATEPVGAVMGAALVSDEVRDNAHTLAMATVDHTPQTKEEVLEYFDGQREATALHIHDAVRLDPPIEREEIRKIWPDFTVPQNFRYVTVDSHAALIELVRIRLNTNHD